MQKAQKLSLLALIIVYLFNFGNLGEAQDIPPQEKTEAEATRQLIPIGNITILGSNSKVLGDSDLSGVYASVNFSPVVKLSEQNYLIPLYSGLYKKQRQIINEEEGGRLYTTIMDHNFSLLHKHLLSELITQRICGFVSLNYNKETSDESFGDGLYDYRDYGASFDYQYDLIKTETILGTLLFGGKYYFRKYPNYQTLLSLIAPQTAIEEDEKDQHVWGPTFRYTHKFVNKLVASVSYDFLLKYFTDKHTIDSSGVLEDKNRNDQVHYFKFDADYRLSKRFILGLNGEIELNNSNQNYYDTMNTPLDVGDDVFVPHYFDYNSYQVKPTLSYLFPLSEDKTILFKLAYAYTLRDYTNRKVKDSGGTYKSKNQEDNIHSGYLNIDFPLTQKLSFLISADYSHTISNMEYERTYRYDYDMYHILSGFSYRF